MSKAKYSTESMTISAPLRNWLTQDSVTPSGKVSIHTSGLMSFTMSSMTSTFFDPKVGMEAPYCLLTSEAWKHSGSAILKCPMPVLARVTNWTPPTPPTPARATLEACSFSSSSGESIPMFRWNNSSYVGMSWLKVVIVLPRRESFSLCDRSYELLLKSSCSLVLWCYSSKMPVHSWPHLER